jgi:hypothetical protein
LASPPGATEPPTPCRPPTTTPRWPPIVLSPESPAAEEARPPWALHRAPTTAPLPYVQLEGLPFAEALALLASPSPATLERRVVGI